MYQSGATALLHALFTTFLSVVEASAESYGHTQETPRTLEPIHREPSIGMIDCGYNSKVSAQNRFFTNSVSAAPAGFSAQRGGCESAQPFFISKDNTAESSTVPEGNADLVLQQAQDER